MDKKISVIIPVYNIVDYLRECVESVLSQTYHNLEIILVDDGSTDGSGELCDRFAKLDNRVRVIHKENGGASDARNAGLDRVTGDYISFIDGDDYIDKEMYSCMEFIVENREDISFVACGMIDFHNHAKKEITADRFTILDKEQAYSCFYKVCKDIVGCSCCNKLYKRELFRELRFEKGIRGEDYELLYRLLDKCHSIACVPEAFYYYRDRPGSTTMGDFSPKVLADLDSTLLEEGVFIQNSYPGLEQAFRLYELSLLLWIWDAIRKSANRKLYKNEQKYLKSRIIGNLKFYRDRKIFFTKRWRLPFFCAGAACLNCYGAASVVLKWKELRKEKQTR